MKNYPLNPFINKWKNWNETYLKELNSKIFALRRYSDFFLTDYCEIDLSTFDPYKTYTDVTDPNNPVDYLVFQTEVLEFHQYGHINQNCYIITDSSDSSAIKIKIADTKGNIIERDSQTATKEYYRYIYLRAIAAGTTIISNAREEGGIDASGLNQLFLTIWDWGEDSGDSDDNENLSASQYYQMLIRNEPIEEIPSWLVGMKTPAYGPPSSSRTNWHNFLIQPSSYASLYSAESITGGLRFDYQAKGGEDYGLILNLILFFNNARYFHRGSDIQQLQYTDADWAHSIYAQPDASTIRIATNTFVPGKSKHVVVPWNSRYNPLMSWMFYDREFDADGNLNMDANTGKYKYGEEIYIDYSFSADSTKLDNNSTMQYNINIQEDNKPTKDVIIVADII